MVATAARTILDSLERLPNDENRTKVAIITVDSSLHFYNLNPSLNEPQMLVVSDLDDVYLPSPSDLLVNLTESIHILKALLEKLPELFKDSTNVNNALGTGLQAAFKMLVSNFFFCKGKCLTLFYSLLLVARSFAYSPPYPIRALVH
jgi:protein transport protein SEC24